MYINVFKISEISKERSQVFIQWKDIEVSQDYFNNLEIDYINHQLEKGENIIFINRLNQFLWLVFLDKKNEIYKILEEARKAGHKIQTYIKDLERLNTKAEEFPGYDL